MNSYMNCDIPHPKTIIHIDIDCFYAQVEMVINPLIRNKPIGIKQKNFLVTSNYIARQMGVQKCMRLEDAIKKLPSLVVIDGSDLTNYRKFSSDIFQILHTYTNLVEKLGFDENFIDVSNIIEENVDYDICSKVFGIENLSFISDNCGCGCFERLKAGAILANKIRANIFDTTGLTSCAGIAHNKLLAKLVSSKNKPNDQTIIFPWQVNDMMSSLNSAKDIPSIGNITFKALNKLGVFTVSDLQKINLATLSTHFSKKVSESLLCLSNGEDSSIVRPSGRPSSLGVEEAFMKMCSEFEVKEKSIHLTKRLLNLLEKDNRTPSSLRVTVRKISSNKLNNYHRETKQVSIDSSVFLKSSESEKSDYISKIAYSSFKEIIDMNKPFHVTLLGLTFAKFESAPVNEGSIVEFFKRCKSDSMISSKHVTSSFSPNPATSTTSNDNAQVNNISLKDVCTKFGNGIKFGETSDSTNLVLKEGCKLSADIDKSVFYALPLGIQKEILNSYPSESSGSETNSLTVKQLTNYERFGTKKSPLKQTKMSDFFMKK